MRVNGVNDTGEIDRVTLGAQTCDRGDSQITTFTPRRKQRNGHSRRISLNEANRSHSERNTALGLGTDGRARDFESFSREGVVRYGRRITLFILFIGVCAIF